MPLVEGGARDAVTGTGVHVGVGVGEVGRGTDMMVIVNADWIGKGV